jgi:succinate dehydrogenase/fumarate reductase flavoprotein subunit
VREGPAAVKELLLDELHVEFDRDAAGSLDLTREGGHSERRIIHAKDATGHAILAALARKVDTTGIIVRRSGWVRDRPATLSHSSSEAPTVTKPLTCFGAYVLDTATGEVVAIVAKKTVLATGGLGGIFLHTTNQPGSVGHGVAMAYRVGARSSISNTCSFTRRSSPRRTRRASSSPRRCAARAACSSMPRASVSWTACIRAVRSRRAMSWPAPSSRNSPRAGEPCVFLDFRR